MAETVGCGADGGGEFAISKRPKKLTSGHPIDFVGIGCLLMLHAGFAHRHTYERVIMRREDVGAIRFGIPRQFRTKEPDKKTAARKWFWASVFNIITLS